MAKTKKKFQGPSEPQYQEYARSAANYKKTKVPFDSSAAELLCIVNPCNPTGNCLRERKKKKLLI
jgi:histidinol-phosphate/aromatic aminotransferase/cobyric acid decarboxylase-like protein